MNRILLSVGYRFHVFILFYAFELINVSKCNYLHFLRLEVRFRNRLRAVTSSQGFVVESPIWWDADSTTVGM